MRKITSKIPSLSECLSAADDTKCMVVKEGAFKEIPSVLASYYCGNGTKHCLAVCVADTNTYAAAGKTVEEILRESPGGSQSAGITVEKSFIFNEMIHAEYQHVETLKDHLKTILEKTDSNQSIVVPVAVGSGTINDLVKRASDELGIRYFCVPTAASVDGYTAHGAALLYGGFKQTLSCKAPLAVVADSEVLSKAPSYLTSSGFGDLAGKIIAGTDWIIADFIFELDGVGELAPGLSAIDSTAWMMVQNPLRNNIAASVHAANGDEEAIKVLFESLGITGFALQYMKDSRSVSGCEHMWSHVWEMENLCVNGVPVTHGHKVTMGTLAAAAFTECLFSQKPSLSKAVPVWENREKTICDSFVHLKQVLPSMLTTARDKFIDSRDKLIRLREGVLDSWDSLKNDVFKKLPPYAELRSLLNEAGCPVKPELINLTRDRIIASAIKAHMIRKRFTVLDLAFELDVFDTVLKKMESSDYFE